MGRKPKAEVSPAVQPDTTKCYACDKGIFVSVKMYERIPKGLRPAAKIALAPEVSVYVCGALRQYDRYENNREPQIACYREAVFKARVCPACGTGPHCDGYVVYPGAICPDCRALVSTAQHDAKKRNLNWYYVDISEVFPSIKWDDEKVRDHFSALFKRSISQRVGYPNDGTDLRSAKFLFNPKYDHRYSGRSGYERDACELTDEQAAALRELGVKFKAMTELWEEEAFREGRSALLGLAKGDVSPKDFDGDEAQRAVRRQQLRETRDRMLTPEEIQKKLNGEDEDEDE